MNISFVSRHRWDEVLWVCAYILRPNLLVSFYELDGKQFRNIEGWPTANGATENRSLQHTAKPATVSSPQGNEFATSGGVPEWSATLRERYGCDICFPRIYRFSSSEVRGTIEGGMCSNVLRAAGRDALVGGSRVQD